MTQTQEHYGDLLDLAVPYALDAVSDDERGEIESRLASAGLPVADAFYDEVRAVRETMAALTAADVEPPPAHLRDRLLATVAGDGPRDNVRTLPSARVPADASPRRWRSTVLSAAAALTIGLAAVGVGMSLRPSAPAPQTTAQQSTAEQVFSASDVHTVSGAIPAGGKATVVFSRDRNAGVLVMNDVPPPKPGTVYQMWLVSPEGESLAGTMDSDAVAPSTTAVIENIGRSTKLAFTVEPGTGSTKPTGTVIAELPLT
jgi:anti-sigma-K factor RskA